MDRRLWLWATIATALAFVALGFALAQWLARVRASARGRSFHERGQRGERAARRLLRARGYRVLATQVAANYSVALDETIAEVQVVADYLVQRAGRRFVAEVKTGSQATRFQHPDTRRQLLEYQLAFAVDSVLLVDVEGSRLQEVRFPLSSGARRSAWLWWIAAFGAGGFVSWFTLR